MSFDRTIWEAHAVQAMTDVFDRLVFRDFEKVETSEGGPDFDHAKTSIVRMGLRVEPGVLLLFAIGDELARDLSATILGMDDSEMDSEDLQDATCELLNMIAGEMKTSLGEAGIEFDLGIPEMIGVWPFASSDDLLHISGRLEEDPIEMCVAMA